MEEFRDFLAWGISLEEIPPEGLLVEFKDYKNLEGDLRIKEPFSGFLKIKKRGVEVSVEGYLKGILELTCDRCLEDFPMKIERSFQIVLVPKKMLELVEEKELSEEELEVSFYENSFISFSDILNEEIRLFLPFINLCKPDCKGLCQYCGKNLNKEICSCPKIKRTSPFIVLKDLLKMEGA